MIYCPKYKINVETEADCNCPSCSFRQKRKTNLGAIYFKCIYNSELIEEYNEGTEDFPERHI